MPRSGLLLKTALVLAALTGGQDRGFSEVSVALERLPDETWRVEGSFFVEASSALAWSVLTDYEDIPRFVSGMKASRRRASLDGRPLLEQEADAGYFIFRRTVRVLLALREKPPRVIEFADLSGKDFVFYRGAWTLTAAPGGTTVAYSLEARPAFYAPGFAERGALKRATRTLLDSVRAEMRSRGRRASR